MVDEELKDKLQNLPATAVKTVAARAALQELPYVFELSDQGNNSIGKQKLLLACLRASIVSGLAVTKPNSEILALNAYVNANLNAAYAGNILFDLPKGADITVRAAFCTTCDIGETRFRLITNLTTYAWNGIRERNADADALMVAPENTEKVFATKLWYGGLPEGYAGLSQQFFDNASGTPWEFWAEWYEGMLNGAPMDWELQRRVALIEDSVWKVGPEDVAEEIDCIRARWEVERALAELKDSMNAQSTARHGIGGNFPPESFQDERLSGAVTLIWEAEEELSKALEQENPAHERIEAILAKFKSGLASFLKWCASKGDLAVDTLIKWGIPVTGAGYAAKYPEKIEALIEAIERWLPFLS